MVGGAAVFFWLVGVVCATGVFIEVAAGRPGDGGSVSLTCRRMEMVNGKELS